MEPRRLGRQHAPLRWADDQPRRRRRSASARRRTCAGSVGAAASQTIARRSTTTDRATVRSPPPTCCATGRDVGRSPDRRGSRWRRSAGRRESCGRDWCSGARPASRSAPWSRWCGRRSGRRRRSPCQQPMGEANGSTSPSRRRSRCAVRGTSPAAVQLAGLEPFDGEAMPLADAHSSRSRVGVAARRRQVHRGRRAKPQDSAVRVWAAQRRDVVDRPPPGVPAGDRAGRADQRRSSSASSVSVSYISSPVLAACLPAPASCSSTTTTSQPASARRCAAMAPVTPAPMTATSQSLIAIEGGIGGEQPASRRPEGRAGAQRVVVGRHAGRPNSDGAGRSPGVRSV